MRGVSKRLKPYVKPFLIICGIYLVAFWAILRANYAYIDDMGRTLEGYKGWGNFSRWTTDFLSMFVHADSSLTDISPIPQILAILILGLTGVILIQIFGGKKKISIWQMLAVAPIGLCPFFLACFSYKFDAPYIALAILASVLPFLFAEKIDKKYIIGLFLGTLVMATTYQAASGIIPVICVLLAFKRWRNGDEAKGIWKFIGVTAGIYILALVIFRVFLMRSFDDYVTTSIWPIGQLIPGIFENLGKYYQIMITNFRPAWLILMVFAVICYLIIGVLTSKRKVIWSILMEIAVVAMIACLCFGFYIALEKPLFEARAMFGIGGLLPVLMLECQVMAPKNIASKIVLVAIIWVFAGFAATYGNALKQQGDYTQVRAQALVTDLSKILDENAPKKVQISGNDVISPVVRGMGERYPMLKMLVPVTMSGDYQLIWGNYYLFHYFDLKGAIQNFDEDYREAELPLITETVYHNIYADGDKILVELK